MLFSAGFQRRDLGDGRQRRVKKADKESEEGREGELNVLLPAHGPLGLPNLRIPSPGREHTQSPGVKHTPRLTLPPTNLSIFKAVT